MAHSATRSPLKYFATSVERWEGGNVILHVTPKWLEAQKQLRTYPSTHQVFPIEDAPALGFQHISDSVPVPVTIPRIIIDGTVDQHQVTEKVGNDVEKRYSICEDASAIVPTEVDQSIDTPSRTLCEIHHPRATDIQDRTNEPANNHILNGDTLEKFIPTEVSEELQDKAQVFIEFHNSSAVNAEGLSRMATEIQGSETDLEDLEVLTNLAMEALELSYQNSQSHDAKEVDRLSILYTQLEIDRGSDSGRESTQTEDSIKAKRRSILLDVANLSLEKSTDSGIFVEDGKVDISKIPEEQLPASSLLLIFLQIFIPYLLAGVGTCATGLLLDKVQDWKVFKDIPQLFILVPPLLGLKGNLEMTLASRLSTQANLGNLKTKQQQWKASWGNTAAITCQAVVVGTLAAVFAVGMGLLQQGVGWEQVLVLTAGCLATAVLASFLLAIVTILVVIYAPRLGIDPDNVATPVAASLGDLTTLAVLAYSAHFLHTVPGSLAKLSACGAVIGFCILLVPLLLLLALKNKFSRQVLKTGWIPVVASVIITSGGGAVLERSVGVFKGLAIFQPVINGLGGNLVAVHASRTSTQLHQGGFVSTRYCLTPLEVFFSKSVQSVIARMLLFMVLPGHAIFAYSLHALRGYTTALANPVFLPIYLSAAFLQVLVLLYVGSVLVRLLWRMGADPDNSAIPLLTALGDLLGSLLLALAFYLFSLL